MSHPFMIMIKMRQNAYGINKTKLYKRIRGYHTKEILFIVEGRDKSEQSDAQIQYARNITYSEGAKRKTKWSLCTKVYFVKQISLFLRSKGCHE